MELPTSATKETNLHLANPCFFIHLTVNLLQFCKRRTFDTQQEEHQGRNQRNTYTYTYKDEATPLENLCLKVHFSDALDLLKSSIMTYKC